MKLLIAFLAMLSVPAFGAGTNKISFAWTLAAEPEVVSYRIYWRTNGAQLNWTNWEDIPRTNTWTVTNTFKTGGTYVFGLVARDSSGVQSQMSDQIVALYGSVPPTPVGLSVVKIYSVSGTDRFPYVTNWLIVK